MIVLQGGLFFALGFLVAALLALMAAPAIWRRAVALTRKRIEASVPLSLNEIQADKDHLRAEAAMKQRKLEVGMEQVKEKTASQMIDLGRTRDELFATKEENVQKTAEIENLEYQMRELRAELKVSEEQLNLTATNLTSANMKLDEKTIAYEDLVAKYNVTIDDFDGQKMEMVARENRMGTVEDEVRETRQLLKETDAQRKRAAEDAKTVAVTLRKEQKRNAILEERMAKLQSDFADMEARVERRDNDIRQLREKVSVASAPAGIGDNGAELAEMRERVHAAESQRDSLQMRNEELMAQLAAGGGGNQNEMIRERISELAAQVTAMASQATNNPTAPSKSPSKAKAKTKAEVNSAKGKKTKSKSKSSGKGTVQKSLADRIRAVNETSEKV